MIIDYADPPLPLPRRKLILFRCIAVLGGVLMGAALFTMLFALLPFFLRRFFPNL